MDTGGDKKENVFIEVLKAALIAIIIVVPIRFFIAQPYIVSGASMNPTFDSGHYIIVDQLTYRFEEPKRGDVVIFKYPKDTSKFFIKRIIGLPGETVFIQKGEVFIVNEETPQGFVLNETYIVDSNKIIESSEHILSNDEYFVLGDNRRSSSDSRIWGPLQENFIVGRAILRILPITDIGLFPGNHLFSSDI